MAMVHQDDAVQFHAIVQNRLGPIGAGDEKRPVDMAGGPLPVMEKVDLTNVNISGDTLEGDEPNEHEKKALRRIGDDFPKAAYLIAVVELCERFTYYGCQGLFQNYISQSPDGYDGSPGLGLGHAGATGLNTFFQFFCYLTPILGAIISDQYLGKYKTILLFAGIYWLGLIILWTTSLPTSIQHGAALGGYVTAIIVVAFGTGGIKSNIAPLIADQYTRKVMAIKIMPKTGERVIIDPAITYQRIYMMFYACINIGCLSLLATPFMEKYVGFWSAFVMCWLMFCVGVAVLIFCRNRYIVRPPQGSIITDSFKAIGMMIKNRNTNAAKPSWRAANGKTKPVAWNDHFVDELKRALRACKVFCFYPIFWVCYGQFSSNFVSQAAQMQGHGMPNDLMQNFDPISIIVVIPLLDRVIYPFLGRYHIAPPKPIMRITIGFVLAGLCLAYAAIVQHVIYTSGPCYGSPGACPAGMDGKTPLPNNVHIAVQTPAYVLIGVAEIFISVTGLEYAYTKAPPSMKSFVQSLYLFTNAIGSALNEALVPATGDPEIMWMYTGVGVASVVTGAIVWFIFHHYDDQEEEMNKLSAYDDVPEKASYESDPETGSARNAPQHLPEEKI
ncbi:hypothetical protein LTR08_006733 [Meristemomyces frigidus]|nr:hypothetical protein LTR08_006733 [Meristemomyces frigidus]